MSTRSFPVVTNTHYNDIGAAKIDYDDDYENSDYNEDSGNSSCCNTNDNNDDNNNNAATNTT